MGEARKSLAKFKAQITNMDNMIDLGADVDGKDLTLASVTAALNELGTQMEVCWDHASLLKGNL